MGKYVLSIDTFQRGFMVDETESQNDQSLVWILLLVLSNIGEVTLLFEL